MEVFLRPIPPLRFQILRLPTDPSLRLPSPRSAVLLRSHLPQHPWIRQFHGRIPVPICVIPALADTIVAVRYGSRGDRLTTIPSMRIIQGVGPSPSVGQSAQVLVERRASSPQCQMVATSLPNLDLVLRQATRGMGAEVVLRNGRNLSMSLDLGSMIG